MTRNKSGPESPSGVAPHSYHLATGGKPGQLTTTDPRSETIRGRRGNNRAITFTVLQDGVFGRVATLLGKRVGRGRSSKAVRARLHEGAMRKSQSYHFNPTGREAPA